MSYNFDTELQKKMFTTGVLDKSYFDSPFPEKSGWKFIYGSHRKCFQYARPADARHKFGFDFKELAQINNFEKARDLFLSREAIKRP